MFYYVLLFADRFAIILVDTIGRALGRNATGKLPMDNWFLPSSPYEMASGWALVCLLLAMGCLEGSVEKGMKRTEKGRKKGKRTRREKVKEEKRKEKPPPFNRQLSTLLPTIRRSSSDAVHRQATALPLRKRILHRHDEPTQAHFHAILLGHRVVDRFGVYYMRCGVRGCSLVHQSILETRRTFISYTKAFFFLRLGSGEEKYECY
jgi:hypothetical protein